MRAKQDITYSESKVRAQGINCKQSLAHNRVDLGGVSNGDNYVIRDLNDRTHSLRL